MLPASPSIRQSTRWACPRFVAATRYFGGLAQPIIADNSVLLDSRPAIPTEVSMRRIEATAAAKATAGPTPVVFVAGNSVETGLVESLAHPGANMTGVDTLPRELDKKRLELLKEAFPKVSRIAILFQTRHLSRTIPQVEAAARSLGLKVTRLEVRAPDDIEPVFGALTRNPVGALMPVSSALFHGERRRIVRLAAKYRLPAMYEHRDFVEAGGLLSYGPDILSLNRRAGAYVDKILKGIKPKDLPVEQPTKFELVLNLQTAKALGLTVPQSLLSRVDEVRE